MAKKEQRPKEQRRRRPRGSSLAGQVPSGSGCLEPLTRLSPLQLTASEEEFLRTYAGVVNSQLSQLPQHSIDQGESRATAPAPRFSGIASCGSFRS